MRAHTKALTVRRVILVNQIFAVNAVTVMAIVAVVQDAILEMSDVGNEGAITAILPVHVAGTLRGWSGGRMRSRRWRARSRMRFDAIVMAASVDVADLVGVVVGAGINLVPESGIAFIKNPVVKMKSAVLL